MCSSAWGRELTLCSFSVPTDVNVFSGLPHGFRRYGNKLSESKRWDSVICEGIKWTLSNPVANEFVVKVE